MARIPRVTQKIFAGSAANNGVFGSAQASGGTLSNVLATIMGLPAWGTGWLSSVLGASKFPPLEEFQSVEYVHSTQIAYLLQQGISEWDAGTTYWLNNIVVNPGTYQLYGSNTDGNSGNALTDTVNWVPLANLAGGAVAGQSFRNRIINGDMRHDQRNRGAAQTITTAAPGTYCVDRFMVTPSGASVVGQRVAGTGQDQYLYQLNGAAGVTEIDFAQRIESTNIYDLEGQAVTLSALLSNSFLGTVTWQLVYPNSADNYSSQTVISSGTFAVTNALTRFTATVNLPSNVVNGLALIFKVGAQTSGTWKIGEVQLEPGSTATSFERLPITVSELLCKRYLPAFNADSSGNTPIGAFGVQGSGGIDTQFVFNTLARVAPTGIVVNSISYLAVDAGGGIVGIASLAFVSGSRTAGQVNINASSGGLTPGYAAALFYTNAAAQLLFTGCEL